MPGRFENPGGGWGDTLLAAVQLGPHAICPGDVPQTPRELFSATIYFLWTRAEPKALAGRQTDHRRDGIVTQRRADRNL